MVRVRYSFGSRHTGNIGNIRKQKEKFPKVMRDVIWVSDIILQIFDIRFVKEMRNPDVEEMIERKGAKLINVLNKVDLVDLKTVDTEMLKDLKPYVFISSKTGYGARDLRDKIKIEAKKVKARWERNKGIPGDEVKSSKSSVKSRVQVGIIGYPNTGKSSLINLLSRKGSAAVSAKAGYTKGMQKIRFTKDILLLDTPGVIPDERYSTTQRQGIHQDTKLGARTYSDVKYPEDVVYYLMSGPAPKDQENVTEEEKQAIEEAKRNAAKIEKFYGINADGDSEKLIEELGRAKGFLKRGGEVDVDRAARQVLRDWQEGKVK